MRKNTMKHDRKRIISEHNIWTSIFSHDERERVRGDIEAIRNKKRLAKWKDRGGQERALFQQSLDKLRRP